MAARATLADLGGERAADALADGLDGLEEDERAHPVEALACLGDARAVQPLHELVTLELGGIVSHYRRGVLRALACIRKPRGRAEHGGRRHPRGRGWRRGEGWSFAFQFSAARAGRELGDGAECYGFVRDDGTGAFLWQCTDARGRRTANLSRA